MSLCRSSRYDLVIVGAGMVGASLATILDRAPLDRDCRILLVESAPVDLNAPPAQPSFDARSTVLSHGTVAYLRQLGLWEALGSAAAPIHHIHVSDQGRFGSARLHAHEQGVDALGQVLENRLLGAVLNRRVAGAARVECCGGVTVEALYSTTVGMRVDLARDGETASVDACLVVLAEGGRSGLGERLGITSSRHEYGQQAIIANVGLDRPHGHVAYERFTPNGPLAILPLPDHAGRHRAALVWTQVASRVEEVLALDDAAFLDRLQAAFGRRAGLFDRVGKRFAYPLALSESREQIRTGLVLLGNVAHSLHPVAGQGFNLAFRDTMRLADCLVSTINAGGNPGDYAVLAAYLDSTREDQALTAAFSDIMTRLFSSEHQAAIWARRFGLFSVDLLPPVKKAFTRRAMGTAGRQVRLARARMEV